MNYIVISTITGCVSISAFASLVGFPIGITSSAIGLKIYTITGGIRKHKSMNKKKKKKHNKRVLLTKSKLNSIEVLICKALIDSNISQDEFLLINDVLKGFYEWKNQLQILVISKIYQCYLMLKQYKTMLSYFLKCRRIQKVTIQTL